VDTEIMQLWITDVWIGHVETAHLADLAALAGPNTTVDITSCRGDLPVLALLEAAAGSITLGVEVAWQHQLSTWPSGYHLGMTYSEAIVRALIVVASNRTERHPDSGVISLHDPRTGSANVALPGLPWGRVSKVPPLAGAAVAFPGWVAHSVAPLREPHAMTVWIAEGR